MRQRTVVIAGGGAAGFFAAIACAESSTGSKVMILERSSHFLSKVRISGGGRCNVTHACFDGRELSRHYPRGGAALLGPFTVFQPRDTMNWFEARGVKLKTEADGRVFPVTDSSETIIHCLMRLAERAGVELVLNCGLDSVSRKGMDGFSLALSNGETLVCDRLMLATGGCRASSAGRLPVSIGHTLEPPVPSLFTFHIAIAWLRELAGISVQSAEVSAPGTGLQRERGGVLITHTGLSGPAILRLSAWGARELHAVGYRFPLRVNWLPLSSAEAIAADLENRREDQPAKLIVNAPLPPLAARLWENLVVASGIPRQTRWSGLSRSARHTLVEQLISTRLDVVGRSLNQEEFVTCGGVRLSEVNFRTMESRICPGLYFGGELLDIDGLTGGFNFQSAWTTGWIAGRSMSTAIHT